MIVFHSHSKQRATQAKERDSKCIHSPLCPFLRLCLYSFCLGHALPADQHPKDPLPFLGNIAVARLEALQPSLGICICWEKSLPAQVFFMATLPDPAAPQGQHHCCRACSARPTLCSRSTFQHHCYTQNSRRLDAFCFKDQAGGGEGVEELP